MAVAVTAEPITSNPIPRAGVTITGLGIGESVVNLWRTADGERNPARGGRRVSLNDAAFLVDWDAPINRNISYEVEVLSGPGGVSRTTAAGISVASPYGWLMDPLVPQTAVPIMGDPRNKDDIYLRSPALSALEYAADVSMYNVMGSDKPLALLGQRMAARGIDTSLSTRSAAQNRRLKRLLQSTSSLLFKPGPEWDGLDLPGTMFLANPVATQLPVNVAMGGELTVWELKSDQVAAPTLKVLTATFTYGDVKMLMSTYQQKQDLMAGKTYLDDLKSPIG